MSTRVSVDIAPELPGAWVERALCGGADPELWFPHPNCGNDHEQVRAAKRICARCPVTAECRRWADAVGDRWAIMGGTTPGERRAQRLAALPTGIRRPCQHCGVRFWTVKGRYCSKQCRTHASHRRYRQEATA